MDFLWVAISKDVQLKMFLIFKYLGTRFHLLLAGTALGEVMASRIPYAGCHIDTTAAIVSPCLRFSSEPKTTK